MAFVNPANGVAEHITDLIGNTPLVRLHSVTKDVPANVYAKVEFFNPGGSIKDRIGKAMIEAAEKLGKLKKGGTIIESTSGNTGLGLAIAAADKGYKLIFTMPDKMSTEKQNLLKAFGAEVIVTPTAVEPDDPESYYSVAKRLEKEIPNSVYLNQYFNDANPDAHYKTTGPEIWAQTHGMVDYFFAAAGTGGTMSGTGRYLKEQKPDVKVIGVDAKGSIYRDYFKTGKIIEAQSYKVEGFGEDILPSTMHFNIADDIVQVNDRESFNMARRITKEEGIFVGGSSGAAVAALVKYADKIKKNSTVVVIFPDTGERYLSKIYNDDWMRENGFLGSENEA